MKSRPIGPGQNILASQNNDRRDDARGGSFLFAHQQLGVLALATEPTNGQVVPIVINGTTVTITAVTSIGSTANNVLIGGSALAFVTNLVNFLRRPDLTSSTQVAASSANQTLLSYVGWAWPGSSTNIVPFSLNKNVNGNTDILTSFNITGITVTSGSWTAQTMQLYVEDGTYYIGTTRVLFTGGSTPTVTAPSSHPRIDILTADSSGTLAWTTGTENASPVAPSYSANKVVICELYNVVSETALYDNENQQSGQGYIYNDVRNIVGPVYIGSQSQLAAGTAILDPGSDAQGDILYYNGSNWVLLAPGTNGQVLLTGGASANPSWGNPTSLVKILDQQITAGTSAFMTSSFAANGYLRVIVMLQGQATNNGIAWQFNSDTGNNYATRGASNDGATATITSTSSIVAPWTGSNSGSSQIHVIEISNYSGAIKAVRGHSTATDGTASTAPQTSDYSGIWNNTSAQITTITIFGSGSTNFTTGDRIIVYGN